MKISKIIGIFVSLAGIIYTLYLTYLSLYLKSCPLNFSFCEKVFLSDYAYIFSIPVSLIGTFGFVLFLFSFLIKKYLLFLTTFISGIFFIIYLQYLLIFELGICYLCTFAHIIFIINGLIGFFIFEKI